MPHPVSQVLQKENSIARGFVVLGDILGLYDSTLSKTAWAIEAGDVDVWLPR